MADEVIHQNPEVTDEFSRAGENKSPSGIRTFYLLRDNGEIQEIHTGNLEYENAAMELMFSEDSQ